ncbi:MAG: sugar ABC transporter substrate-binding protein [Xylanivirga thermophila]|jgi:multiple sugar transport system substrate-binding protein|uniref:ABC transporter substrate-binding protein n=1 Tax=Xylanivirga thermophila TaxID=2496273 RepID=UPI0039F4F5DB
MKRSFRVVSLVLALCMLLVLAMTGCGKNEDNKQADVSQDNTQNEDKTSDEKDEKKEEEKEESKDITIRYGLWGSQAELDIQKENAKNSEEVYPGLKIEVQAYPDSETFWNKLPAEVAAKTAPDIVKLTNEGYYEYVAKGMLVPIEDAIKEANIDLGIYGDSAKGIWTVDDKIYGLPLSVAPAMFIVNKDMWDAAGLKEYPKTWDEVKEAAKALTKDGVKGIVINDHEYHITNYALSFGGGWGNGKTINSEGNVKAIEFIVDMYKEGLAISPKQAGFGWDGEVFANKKGAMTTGGWWYIGYLKEAAPDINYEILPMPEGTTKGCTMHSDAMVVMKDAQDKVAAVKAAAYLTREEAQKNLMEGVGINPAIPELSDQYYEVNPQTKAVQPMVEYAKDFGYPADTKKFNDALVNAVDDLIFNNSNREVKDYLDEIQEQFNK